MQKLACFLTLVVALLGAFALSRAGMAQEESLPSIETDGEEGGNFLFIPGIGKIPLPPGARAFGPGNGPHGLGPERLGPERLGPERLGPERLGPKSAAPPPPPPKDAAERRADEMAHLLSRLEQADDEQEAASVAAAILRRWSRSESDTVDLLAARALAAEAVGAAPLARELLDYVVALSPHWADGFVRRARVRAEQGDDAGALSDLETAARLEPKRFDALAALGALAEKAGEKKRALDAYRKSLAISPQQDALRKTEERLRIEVEGRDI